MSFLFLSKLLPLFFYPVGLICLLLIVTLVLWWKNPRWVPYPVALALIVLLLATNGWVSNSLVRSLEWQHLPPTEIPRADAIVVLGGAMKSKIDPRPMVDVAESGDRVIYAAQLYQEQKAPVVIPTGGRISWLGGGFSEATDMAQLLQLMGVPESAIIEEPNALNTYENAVYVKEILAEKGMKRVLLVTSAMHMPRALKIFQHREIDTIAAPTDFLVSQQEVEGPSSSIQAFILSSLPDADRIAKTTKAIKEYIGTTVYRLKGWL